MRVAVYLGSSCGHDPKYAEYAAELGTAIGRNGFSMVYGGADDGLMGITANHAIEAGAEVIGVIPEFFLSRGHKHLNRTYVVKSMPERKQKMIELSDAFVAMPGGWGTLDEIVEVISLVRIGIVQKPAVFFSPDGYYDCLRDFFDKMVWEGFLEQESLDKIQFAASIDEVMERIRQGS